MEIGRLHVIVNVTPGRDWLALARQVLDGGAPVLQLRAKDATDHEAYDMAGRLRELCDERGATLLVDDRVDVARAAGAAGVHVGEHDLPVEAVRRVVDEAFVVGATAREPEAARAQEAAGATYLGVGPCYATSSKTGLPDPIGLATLAAVCAAVRIPVIAIAGVTIDRVPELVAAGAHGVAVIGAIADAADPAAATTAFLAALDRAAAAA